MKHHTFQLDPTVRKQLQDIAITQDPRVQELLDNPGRLPTFLDFRVDYALSSTFDKASYHKYIVITSNSPNHILNI